MKIDYKILLEKYMNLVVDCEGSTFIPSVFYNPYTGAPETNFNKEEVLAILAIEKSLQQ